MRLSIWWLDTPPTGFTGSGTMLNHCLQYGTPLSDAQHAVANDLHACCGSARPQVRGVPEDGCHPTIIRNMNVSDSCAWPASINARAAVSRYRTGLSSTCNATTEIRERFWINRSGHIVAREMSPGFLSVGAGGSGQEDRFDSSR